jgi:hypothetical protein
VLCFVFFVVLRYNNNKYFNDDIENKNCKVTTTVLK